jgi:hypothetical protein
MKQLYQTLEFPSDAHFRIKPGTLLMQCPKFLINIESNNFSESSKNTNTCQPLQPDLTLPTKTNINLLTNKNETFLYIS